ncbi:MAG: biotin--[acetyl-CoA-carboxylase] ligase [bacterium]|nr:biotin--[acetyl-CoA-carboxylase] ligase [bacterium]
MQPINPSDLNCACGSEDKTLAMRFLMERPLQPARLEEIARAARLTLEEAALALAELLMENASLISPAPETFAYQPDDQSLHPDAVAASLATRWWGHQVWHGAEIASTIDVARRLLESPQAHGLLVCADSQTSGRGRQGAAWNSPRGKDLLLTFLVRLRDWNPPASLLSLYAAGGVVKALVDSFGVDARIKWPNDVIVDGKKLGGVLVERVPEHNLAMVSLGLNVLSGPADWPGALRREAVSLASLDGAEWSRRAVLIELGRAWETLWDEASRDGGECVLRVWRERSATAGRRVSLIHREREYAGVAEDIDLQGRLRLRLDDGAALTLPAEEAHRLRLAE